MRHSKASAISVQLFVENSNINFIMQDNGKGIAEEELTQITSLGILGIKERIALFNGEMKIQGIPNAGTTISIKIPTAQSKEAEQ